MVHQDFEQQRVHIDEVAVDRGGRNPDHAGEAGDVEGRTPFLSHEGAAGAQDGGAAGEFGG